ncbi:MAG: ABC transporter permease, partial [Treponema sp.]|nr:ABC transporter permease [Treponema sp.]
MANGTNGSNIFNRIKEILSKSGPLVALLIMVIFLSIRTRSFLSVDNFINIIRQAASYSMVAIGMMLAILTGGIDLSVGSTMALAMVLMSRALGAGFPPLAGIFVCLGGGFLLGLLNGLALTKLKLPHPFISTMGTQNIFRGICLLLTGGTPVSGMPAAVKWAGASHLGIVPVSLLIVIALYVVFGIFLGHTPLGRRIYAVGGNRDTARLAGVDIDFTLCAV